MSFEKVGGYNISSHPLRRNVHDSSVEFTVFIKRSSLLGLTVSWECIQHEVEFVVSLNQVAVDWMVRDEVCVHFTVRKGCKDTAWSVATILYEVCLEKSVDAPQPFPRGTFSQSKLSFRKLLIKGSIPAVEER